MLWEFLLTPIVILTPNIIILNLLDFNITDGYKIYSKTKLFFKRLINQRYNYITEIMVHTGQHFDQNMSDIFFNELDITKPSYFLNINNINANEAIIFFVVKLSSISFILIKITATLIQFSNIKKSFQFSGDSKRNTEKIIVLTI